MPTFRPEPAPETPERPLTMAERAARSLAEDLRPQHPLEVRLLLSSLEPAAVHTTICAAFVPGTADWCFLYQVDQDGIPRRVAVGHADPVEPRLLARIRAVHPGPGWANLTAQAIRDRTPRLFREVSDEVLRWAAHDDDHHAVLKDLAPRSMLVLPFVARDRVVGGVTLMRGAGRLGYTEEDLVAAQKLCVPIAIAMDNAREAEVLRAARAEAERLADVERHERLLAQTALLRLRRIQSLASTLSAPLSAEAAARVAFESGLALLGPSDGAVALGAGDRLEVLHAPGWPSDVVADWSVIPRDAPALIAEAWRAQRPIWISSLDDLRQRYPSAGALVERLGGQAYAAVPITCDGACIGALNVGFRHPRYFDDAERDFVLAVAALLGQAVARARLRE